MRLESMPVLNILLYLLIKEYGYDKTKLNDKSIERRDK